MPIAYVQFEPLYWSAWDTITKYQRLGSLNSTNLFSHSAGAQKSKITVLVGMVSSETSLTYSGHPLAASSPGHSLCGMSTLSVSL